MNIIRPATHLIVVAIAALAVVACRAPNSSSTGQQDQVQPQPQPMTPAPQGSVPAGTRMLVRLTQPLDSQRQGAGHRFTAVLEADLMANTGIAVAKRGSTVYGQLAQAKKSGRLAGKSEMTIVLTDVLVNNQLAPIRASGVQATTENTGKSTVGATAAGAAIGGIAGGSKGARRGAAVGLGASVLTSGNQIKIPAGTILEFTLADHLVPPGATGTQPEKAESSDKK